MSWAGDSFRLGEPFLGAGGLRILEGGYLGEAELVEVSASGGLGTGKAGGQGRRRQARRAEDGTTDAGGRAPGRERGVLRFVGVCDQDRTAGGQRLANPEAAPSADPGHGPGDRGGAGPASGADGGRPGARDSAPSNPRRPALRWSSRAGASPPFPPWRCIPMGKRRTVLVAVRVTAVEFADWAGRGRGRRRAPVGADTPGPGDGSDVDGPRRPDYGP